MKGLAESSPFHLLTNPHVINRFIFGHGVVIYYIFSSETTWPIKAKFYVKHLYNGGTNVYIYNLGHMTKLAAMPIYGKNPSKIFFSETNRLISMKFCVKHPWLKYYNLYINHDPVIILTQFMARSAWVAHAFE